MVDSGCLSWCATSAVVMYCSTASATTSGFTCIALAVLCWRLLRWLLPSVRAPSSLCRVVTHKTEHRTLYLTDWSYDHDEQRFDEIVCELDGYPGWRILPDVAVTDRGLLLRRLVIE